MITELPPLLTTGIGLLIGSSISVVMVKGRISKLRAPLRNLGLGVFGLFGYHFALFAAFQNAPIVQVNLVNYLWPVLIVLFAPLVLGSSKLTLRIIAAAIIGFTGAGISVLAGQQLSSGFETGYLYALAAATIWAGYSLGTKRLGDFPISQIGVYGFPAF
jgi:drug/metabolite transporter (DMT)-like permease